MELGFKWRFYNSLYFQVAIAPNYAFNPDSSSSWFGIAGNYESVTLPVQLEYSVSKWTLNMELGYSVVKDDPDELSYGVALRHPILNRIDMLVELSGSSDQDFNDNGMEFRLGFDMEVSENLHFLFAVGSEITDPDENEHLNSVVYFGIQWLGPAN